MSRLAQEVSRQATEIRRAAKKEKPVAKEQQESDYSMIDAIHAANEPDAEVAELQGGVESDMTEATPAETAEEKETTVAKKKSKKAKAAPKAKAKGKKAPAAKAERKPRAKKVVSGEIVGIEARGLPGYCVLVFEEGQIMMSPSSNRTENRDIAVKALKALLKKAKG